MTGFSVTTREPEFNDRDRALMFADYADEHAARSTSGVLMSEATDPKNQYAFKGELITDFAVAAGNKAMEAYRADAPPGMDLSHLRVRVHRAQ